MEAVRGNEAGRQGAIGSRGGGQSGRAEFKGVLNSVVAAQGILEILCYFCVN